MANDYVITALSILGLAVTILGGMFIFLWNGITKLRDDMTATIDAKAGEHRQGQQQLWSELRLQERLATEHRNRVQERISELATRDEMRQDLKAMEDRIQSMIRADVHRV